MLLSYNLIITFNLITKKYFKLNNSPYANSFTTEATEGV